MFIHYRTQGIILVKKDRGEADRLFTVYTKEFGMVNILGKAIRKISSKLRAAMAPFSVSEIEFIQGRGFKTLTDAILAEKFENLSKDLEILKIANQISNSADDLIKGQESDPDIWELLIKTFRRINRCAPSSKNCFLIYYYFLWNLISVLGYQPELYRCLLCQQKISPEKIYFSAREGGVICQNCRLSAKSAKEISKETVKLLRMILKNNFQLLEKIKLSQEDLKLLESASKTYLSCISSILR